VANGRESEEKIEPCTPSQNGGNPSNMGPRFRGDDNVFELDDKPVTPITMLDSVEHLALHWIGRTGSGCCSSVGWRTHPIFDVCEVRGSEP